MGWPKKLTCNHEALKNNFSKCLFYVSLNLALDFANWQIMGENSLFCQGGQL